jgi:hypothetical protein
VVVVMPLSRAVLERQLKEAEHSLAERVQVLKGAGKSAEALALDPAWRNASATCTSIRRRLTAVAATEANNTEVIRRKSEPKPEPVKEPKAEKTKPEKAKADKPKSEAKGEAKSGEQKPKKAKSAKAE